MLATARRLFGEVGYHATGTEEVVAQARVTRGALYHHFKSKEALFEAVYRQVALEVAVDAQAETRSLTGQIWPRVMATLHVYLELLTSRREIQRILLIDGPAVLGWERWRALRAESDFAGWVRTFTLLAEQGQVAPMPIEPMAQIILAAVDEAILTAAHADDPKAALADMMQALSLLLGGLRPRPAD